MKEREGERKVSCRASRRSRGNKMEMLLMIPAGADGTSTAAADAAAAADTWYPNIVGTEWKCCC